MNVTIFRDNRQSVDWLATGKFALCFFCYPQEAARAQKQGLPVDEIKQPMKEGAGLTSHSGQIGLINKPAHPNAAKVFINWLVSKEGQLTLQRVYSEGRRGASNSRRIDIPKDMVPPEDRLVEGVEYLDVETPERREMAPVIKIFEEALAQAEKKR
jgi:iron(III) transport system substrate-binding protein